jgi:hypothetical protein
MKGHKIIGSIIILIGIAIMLQSVIGLYIQQCTRSQMALPFFWSNRMTDFFQIESTIWGKSVRMLLILILPSLGMEIFKNKENRLFTGKRILKTLLILLGVAIFCFILYYPFFENR